MLNLKKSMNYLFENLEFKKDELCDDNSCPIEVEC